MDRTDRDKKDSLQETTSWVWDAGCKLRALGLQNPLRAPDRGDPNRLRDQSVLLANSWPIKAPAVWLHPLRSCRHLGRGWGGKPRFLLALGFSSLSLLCLLPLHLPIPLFATYLLLRLPKEAGAGTLASAWLPEKVRYSPAAALVASVPCWVPLSGRRPPSRAGRGRAGRGAPFC